MKPTRRQCCSEAPTQDCLRLPTTKPYDASGGNWIPRPHSQEQRMTAEHDLTDLVQLSRTLGEPARRLAILAEGNTSQRVAEDQLAVKATGRSLRHASAADFVVVSLRRLSDIVDDSKPVTQTWRVTSTR